MTSLTQLQLSSNIIIAQPEVQKELQDRIDLVKQVLADRYQQVKGE